MTANKSWSLGFEFVDIEIIDHKKDKDDSADKWSCNQCSLFFLDKEKLLEHRKKHSVPSENTMKCRYCNKILSNTEESKESFVNGKCETCEYRCSQCPQRFLRNSSLINHEKNHLLIKKKRTVVNSKKLVNGFQPASSSLKVTKKRQSMVTDPEDETFRSKKKETEKNDNKSNVSHKKKQKVNSETQHDTEADGENDTLPALTNKRSPVKTNQRVEVNTMAISSKSKPTSVNVRHPAAQATLPKENTVNYKPFSCHVCGETFASDNALLEHIRLHGENAAKNFKCKHCDEEFDDIYKMQYHLAICPFAEDELESTLKNSIPSKFLKSMPSSVSNGRPRKKGRPRKISEISPDINIERTNLDMTPSLITRGSLRKRKTDESTEPVHKTPKVTKNLLKRRGKRQIKSETDSENESMNSDNGEDNYTDDCAGNDSLEDLNTDYVNCSYPIGESFESSGDERKKIHACPFPRCGIKFSREKALLCHMRNHNDDFDDTLKCHKCDIPFDDVPSLRSHIDVCKGIKEEKDDDFNDRDYTEAYDQVDRPLQQRTRGEFVCNTCGRAYVSEEKLNSHYCHDGNPLSMKFPCRLCNEELTNQQLLKRHFEVRHPQHLQFECPNCLQEFDDLNEINDHVLSHLKTNLECAVCLVKMKTKSDLQKHYHELHPGDRNLCLICNRRFADSSGLAKHRHIHTGMRPYSCPFCPMAFTLKASQVVHIRRHTNYRPYKCTTCPKAFFNSGDLRKHNRIHTGERPYECDICKSRFTLRECLNTHMKTHSNIRPFKCPECPKTFNSRTRVKYHMLVHTGVRPFKCPICADSYFHVGSLQAHIKTQHINKFSLVHTCQICGAKEENVLKMVHHMMTHRMDQVGVETSNFFNKIKLEKPTGKNKRGRPRKYQTSENAKTTDNNITIVRKRGRPKKVHCVTETSSISGSGIMSEIKTAIPLKNSNSSDDEANVEYTRVKVEEPDEGVLAVEAFEPDVIEELGCSMCMATFTSHASLLEHVYVHI